MARKNLKSVSSGEQANSKAPSFKRISEATISATEEALENPFKFFNFQQTAEIFGWGSNVPSALASKGAPVLARKMNPRLLMKWIEENWQEVKKLRL